MVNHLCAIRKKQNITQEKLSELSNVGRSTISTIETGTYEPGIRNALMLAKALHCPVEDIFEIEEADQMPYH